MSWPHGDPDAVVKSVLAQPDYRASGAQEAATKPQPSLLEVIWNWVVDHVLRPLFHPLLGAIRASHGVGTIVAIVLIVASVALLAFLIYRLIVAFVRPEGSKRRGSWAGIALDERLGSRLWRERARAAAAAGDYRAAIAALFSAALAALDERAVVAFDGARTPGEYRRLVRGARRAASAPFDDLTARFVRAAYAEAATGANDFDAADRAYADFEPALVSA
jgi:hypothetical protein